ncbi:MAG TPA: M20/M25/M40 family metallo-hydrolase [Candidatus Nanoarchaeia archaeon]|nr:M20/M25/M40 family metallo-hydrolase [Candidatus Nanoarchaeia archaeon]
MSINNRLLEEYIKGYYADNFWNELGQLVSVPSISAKTIGKFEQGSEDFRVQQERRQNLGKIVSAEAAILELYGFTTKIIKHNGIPALVAHLNGTADSQLLTIYNHIDVQPADDLDKWVVGKTQLDPFSPYFHNGVMYGRGTTDDKGPALNIIHAINFLRSNGYELPNIQVIYETQEESGSQYLEQILKKGIGSGSVHTPDSVLISDTILTGGKAVLTYKLRGNLRAFIRIQTGDKEAHSGLASVAENPLEALMRLVPKLKDEGGKVLIPNFYDEIIEPTSKELGYLKQIARNFDVEDYRKSLGIGRLPTTNAEKLLHMLGHEPDLKVLLVENAQHSYGEIKTSIPYKAGLGISIRLVPGQDPQKILRSLRRYVQSIDKRFVVTGNGQPASITDVGSEYIKHAFNAMKFGYGQTPEITAEGGTIGAVSVMQKAFGLRTPIVLIPQSLPEHQYHGALENFDNNQAERGFRVMVHYINSLGKLRK